MRKEFVQVAEVDAVPAGEITAAKAGDERVALANLDGDIYAVSAYCPHVGGSFAEGGGLDVDEKCVICPLHGWRFDVTTGRGSTVSGSSVECFPVEIRDGAVFVEITVAD